MDIYSVGRLVFALLLLTAVGCSENNSGIAVSGNVFVDGVGLPHGLIVWKPEGTPDVRFAADIKGGEFLIPVSAGLLASRYRVEIYAVSPALVQMSKGNFDHSTMGKSEPFRDVAPEFNVRSQLTREVVSKGDNEFNFEVQLVN